MEKGASLENNLENLEFGSQLFEFQMPMVYFSILYVLSTVSMSYYVWSQIMHLIVNEVLVEQGIEALANISVIQPRHLGSNLRADKNFSDSVFIRCSLLSVVLLLHILILMGMLDRTWKGATNP
jgi:hypothetical protein